MMYYPYYFDLEQILENGLGLVSSFSLANTLIIAFTIYVNYRVLEKAGERGWKSLIPFYRDYLEYKLYWEKGLYWLNLVMPFVAIMLLSLGAICYRNTAALVVMVVIAVILLIACIIFKVMLKIRKGKCFGESAGFGIGLLLLNTIFCAIIAFDKKCVYVGKVEPKQEEKQETNSSETL